MDTLRKRLAARGGVFMVWVVANPLGTFGNAVQRVLLPLLNTFMHRDNRYLVRWMKRHDMTEQATRGYAIAPCSTGDGWKLTLFRNGHEVSSKVFPIPPERREPNGDSWHHLNRRRQPQWVTVVGSSGTPNARHMSLMAIAHADARNEARAWMNAGK